MNSCKLRIWIIFYWVDVASKFQRLQVRLTLGNILNCFGKKLCCRIYFYLKKQPNLEHKIWFHVDGTVSVRSKKLLGRWRSNTLFGLLSLYSSPTPRIFLRTKAFFLALVFEGCLFIPVRDLGTSTSLRRVELFLLYYC